MMRIYSQPRTIENGVEKYAYYMWQKSDDTFVFWCNGHQSWHITGWRNNY